ncbi:MAG: hypothetical protein NZ893_02970 [Candidatus Aenigmarchaeota archaeon]|nr:hypothetical protein [Candidatus Aenigmarchaeota archaeon]
MKQFILFLTIFSLFLYSSSAQITVGVSPPVLDLGEVQRGETKIAKFNIITSTSDTLIVRLEAVRGKADFFTPNNYWEYLANYSEEDAKTWIKFLSNPVELEPVNIPGSNLKSAREVTFILQVPENAEAGYHTAYIMLDPKSPKQLIKPITIRTVFPLTILFKVPGEALRGGKIYETMFLGTDKDTTHFNTMFQNTGTVTLLITSGKLNVYSISGDLIATTHLPSTYVKPGELKHIRSLINQRLPEGEYNVQSIVYFSSDFAEKNSTIKVREFKAEEEYKERQKFPWILLIIILLVIILAYYWYKRS